MPGTDCGKAWHRAVGSLPGCPLPRPSHCAQLAARRPKGTAMPYTSTRYHYTPCLLYTSTPTASTAPRSADLTGTAVRPCPRSRAKRIPVTAGDGSPQAAAAPASRDTGEVESFRRRSARCGATRYASANDTAPRPKIRTSRPVPSTVQSKASPGLGSRVRAGPMGAKGDSATAISRATTDPTTTAPRTPSRPSAMVTAGLAPRARSTPMSSASAPSRLPMAWPATSKAAKPAIAPNTPNAIDSGLVARSTWPSTTEVTWKL